MVFRLLSLRGVQVSALMSSKSTASWKEQLRGVLKNSVRSSLSIAYCFFFLAAFNCSSRFVA